jgi:hypothetical protein
MKQSHRRIDSRAMRCVRHPPNAVVRLTAGSNPQDGCRGNDRES